jgi:proton-translocating NADH-quinone oxidoreductase chain N
MSANAFIWLIALLLGTSPAIYLVGRLGYRLAEARSRTGRSSITRLAMLGPRWTALVVLVSAWAPFGVAARDFGEAGPATFRLGAIALRFDGLSLLVAALALVIGTLVVLFSGPDMAGKIGEEKYHALVVMLVGALIGLACASDLFNLWVWFELMAIASYALAGFYQHQPAALDANVKYLVQSAAGSTLILFGIALVLMQVGTLDLVQLHSHAVASPVLLAAGGLFVAGFGVKAALVPLHTWLPDMYTQAPSGISAVLSGVVSKAGLVALLRVLGGLAGVSVSWGVLLMGFGAMNILVGNLLALRQTQVKRLLAYSSIGQLGYILLGVGIGVSAGQGAGAQGGLFHLITHGLMSGLAFLAVGALLYGLRGAAHEQGALTVSELSGAAGRYPLAAFALSLAVLGLAGLPLLAGFMSKWQIFVAGIATRDPAIGALIVFAALNSVLSLAYYAPLVNAVYRITPSAAVRHGGPLPISMRVPLVLLALIVLALGIWPGLMQPLTEPAGAVILAAFEH